MLSASVLFETVKLNYNNIFTIIKGAFEGLDELITIDLSCNRLTTFSGNIFNEIPNLKLLRPGENDIKFVDCNDINALNAQFIESTACTMICIPSPKAIFIVRKPWFLICGHLLMTDGIRICSYCTSFALISCNIMSLTQYIFHAKKRVTDVAFALSVFYLNAID